MQANLDRYVAASEKRAALKSRVIVGEWPFRMVTIGNTPPILNFSPDRARGCVNTMRGSRLSFEKFEWRTL